MFRNIKSIIGDYLVEGLYADWLLHNSATYRKTNLVYLIYRQFNREFMLKTISWVRNEDWFDMQNESDEWFTRHGFMFEN